LVRDEVYQAGFEAICRMFGGAAARPPLRPATIPVESPLPTAASQRSLASHRATGTMSSLREPAAYPPIDGGEERPAARPGSLPLPAVGGEVARDALRSGGYDAGGLSSIAPAPASVPAWTARAIVVERYGGPEVLQPKEVILPRRPAQGE